VIALLPASLRLGANLVLAYRLEVLVRIVSASLVAFLNWAVWSAIFVGRDTVAGRTASELTTYVIVAWVITTFYGTRVDELVASRFRTGDISIDMLRPWNLQLHLYFRDLGRAGTALLLTTLPLALWTGILLPLRAPEHTWTPFVFALSLLLAHAISFGIAWLVGLAAFLLRNSTGLAHLKATIIGIFSGALVPLDLYPDALQQVILWLPFQGMSHVPAQFFTEHVALNHIWFPLTVQVGWALALAALGALAYRAACRRLVIQGG
jgi:ABC-2 type transport system permease protein